MREDTEKQNNPEEIAVGAQSVENTEQSQANVENTAIVQNSGTEAAQNVENKTAEDANGGKGVKVKKIQDAEEALKSLDGEPAPPPKRKKYNWLSFIFLFGVIALGIWAMTQIVSDMGDEALSLGDIFAQGSWEFALISVAVLLVILFCEWMKYVVVMKTTTGKLHLRTSSKVAFLGKFYDNITPFAAGGQPMQIHYLHKKGLSGGVSSAVVLIKYFAQMFCWTFLSLLLMACNTGVLSLLDGKGTFLSKNLIMAGAWIGLAVNMFLPVMIVLFALLPKMSRALTSFAVNIGAKVKIVKNKEKAMTKAQKTVNDFRAAFSIMAHKPLNFILLIVFCITETLLSFAFPYFIMRTFNALPTELVNEGISVLISVMALNVYASLSVTIIPTPGNSGALEAVITTAFSAVATPALLTCVVVAWRSAVYYIYIIIGLVLTIYEFARKIYRTEKARRRERAELFRLYGARKQKRLKEPEEERIDDGGECISKEELTSIVSLANVKAIKAKLADGGYVNCERDKAYRDLKLSDVAVGAMFNHTQEFADEKNNFVYSGGVYQINGAQVPEYIVIEIDKTDKKSGESAICRLLVYAKDKKQENEETTENGEQPADEKPEGEDGSAEK